MSQFETLRIKKIDDEVYNTTNYYDDGFLVQDQSGYQQFGFNWNADLTTKVGMHKYDLRTDAESLIGAFLPRFTKLTVDIYECPTASLIMSATHLEIFKPFNSEGTFDLSL